ncbi:MAG: ribosomal protein S18-alanine N-acetyltransferase [Ruminococcus sp.]|nr:ribosomal protein S18-alanine N-acetyltransferase [Ruminococcus sp.]
MKIVSMTKEHLEGVLVVENNSFTNPWSEESFLSELEKETSINLVALKDEKVVGYAVLSTVLDEGDLLDIAVDENFRRQKIASALFEKIFETALERKLSFITLEVRESSVPAIKLYQSRGFETVGIRKNYYHKPTENAVLMTKYF